MIEKRRAHSRKDLFPIGELLSDDGAPPTDCLVRNSSEAGALMEVKETAGLPQTFRLYVESTGLDKRCVVVRQTKHLFGVAFLP
jgi:hypothetical protein